MPNFHVGETVVHWNYGLGEVIKMDVQFIHDREMLCYVVKIHELTIWVAADDPNISSLRKPTPENQFTDLFAILKSDSEPLPQDRFDRKAYLTERMKDGRLASICRVIRDLISFGHEKKLNDNDKTTLERAERMLVNEWEFSLSVPRTQAHAEMMSLLKPA